MTEPLSKDAFEIYLREHQLHLDAKFDKLAGCVDSVKVAREKAWTKHDEKEAARCECQDKKMKRLHKVILVGCICAAIMGAILAPYVGFDQLAGFALKLLTGTTPIPPVG